MLAMASPGSVNESQLKISSSVKSPSLPLVSTAPITSTASTSKPAPGMENSQTSVQGVSNQPTALLPNGVFVTQLAGLSPDLMKTIFQGSLSPTSTAEAIKAFNLTTQLTLKYIQQLALQKNVIANSTVANPEPTIKPKKSPVTILPRPVNQTSAGTTVPNILSRQLVPSALQLPLFKLNAPRNQKPDQQSTQVTSKQKSTPLSVPTIRCSSTSKSLSSRELPWRKPWSKKSQITSKVTQPKNLSGKKLSPSGITHSQKITGKKQPQSSSKVTSMKVDSQSQKEASLKSKKSVSPAPGSKCLTLESRKRKQKFSCLDDSVPLTCLEDSSSLDTSQDNYLQCNIKTNDTQKQNLDISRKRKHSLVESSQNHLTGKDVQLLLSSDAPQEKKRKLLTHKKPRLKPTNPSLKDSSLLDTNKLTKPTLKKPKLAPSMYHVDEDSSLTIINPSDSSLPNSNQDNPRKESKTKNPKLSSRKLTTSNSNGRNFVKRMASLNASARVSALLELETVISKSVATCKKEKIASTLHKLAKSGKLPAGNYIAVEHPVLEAESEFNTLGLLYNGSTIHPSARKVFYSCVNGDLVLPALIHPLVYPSKITTVGKMVKKSLNDMQQSHPKLPKSNNGWTAFGNPIKTIEYTENDVTTTRQYYIGIQRKKETVFVRDTVALRAGSNEKPYIGKIASIWRQKDGLMMSVFWYYRPDELELSTRSGLTFAKNELLASQHYDVNSVACIEEKYYILGRNQYCRYRAAKAGAEHHCTLPHMHCVPPIPSRDSSSCYVNFVSEDRSEELGPTYTDLGPSMDTLVKTDPSFVYVCHRGYNHVTGRIYHQ